LDGGRARRLGQIPVGPHARVAEDQRAQAPTSGPCLDEVGVGQRLQSPLGLVEVDGGCFRQRRSVDLGGVQQPKELKGVALLVRELLAGEGEGGIQPMEP
jgi:hypothetical protein